MTEPTSDSPEKNVYVELRDGELSVFQIRGAHTKAEINRFLEALLEVRGILALHDPDVARLYYIDKTGKLTKAAP